MVPVPRPGALPLSRLFTTPLVGVSLVVPGRAETPARSREVTVDDSFTLAPVTQVATGAVASRGGDREPVQELL